jgi:arylsulfatase A-like enzyme
MLRTWKSRRSRERSSVSGLGAMSVVGLVLALLSAPAVASGGRAMQAGAAAARPNILFVLVDDMSLDQLAHLDQVNALVADRGVRFDRAYAPYPLCCPARATILSGQYPHNHGVMGNRRPLGGVSAFRDRETLPVWLRRSGYTTMLIGKYLNNYGSRPRYRPPGWSDWRAVVDELEYRTWAMNRNGDLVGFRNRYQTTEVAAQARRAITRYGTLRRPFFIFVSFIAPHAGWPRDPGDPRNAATPNVSDRYRDALESVIPPKPASFNEADMSDKPAHMRGRRLFRWPTMVEIWQQRTEALLSVDEAVASFVARLRRIRELDNTIIVFASDNGFLHGEHRWRGKSVPYEEATHIPLVVRGPGFPAGTTARQLVSLVDVAPTFVRAARARATRTVDGAPLQRIAADPRFLAGRSIVLEAGVAEIVGDHAPVDRRNRFYWGVRTPGDKVFVRYATREREYYDLRVDPGQLRNAVDLQESRAVVARLSRLLASLKNCRGLQCRQGSSQPTG